MRLRARTLVLCVGAVGGALLVAGQLVSACVFDPAGDCMDARTCKSVVTSSSSSSSSGTGAGGSDGGPACKSAADCSGPGPDGGVLDGGVCLAFATCSKAGECGLAFIPGEATDQPYGTCTKRVCDADGGVTSVPDDANLYDAGNPCIVVSCGDAGPTYTVPEGGPCPTPDAGSTQGTCVAGFNGQFAACVECTLGMATEDCVPAKNNCSQDLCVPGGCVDVGLNVDAGETDVGCGGPNCAPCANGDHCLHSTDCQSANCIVASQVCAAPSCMDNVKNEGESDVDCGGPCPPCAAMLDCFLPSDCKSQVCIGGICQMPTCTDGVQNGDETGVDCGGVTSACPPCPLE